MTPNALIDGIEFRYTLYELDASARSAIKQLWPIIVPHLDKAVDDILNATGRAAYIKAIITQHRAMIKKLEIEHFKALLSGELDERYFESCRRTVEHVRSGSLGDVIAGFTDQCALALVARTPVPAMAAALSRAAGDAPEGKARWHAGVAPRDAAPVDAAALLDAAGDAATAAAASGEVVRPWSPDDALMAPDVIVVEDDPALADMLRYALASFGYSMRMYRTGPEALEALRVMRPRRGRRPLVLLDIDLPGLDGHSLHERLRVERPGVFGIVFASVHASEGDQLRALKSGAIDYLVKPISLRVLVAKLPRWLALAAAGSA